MPTPTTTYMVDTEEIKFESPRLTVRLVVSEPTILTNSRRYSLGEDVRPKVLEREDWDPTTQGVIFYSYPALVASVVEAEGFPHWPPTLDEFAALPAGLWDKWTEVTKRRCPDWFAEEQAVVEAAQPDPKEPPASSDA